MSDARTVGHEAAAQSFRWEACDAYLFDIDGTLLNSRDGVHYNAFHAALHSVYRIDERIDHVPVHGNTDIGILRAMTARAGIAEAAFQRALPQALAHMRRAVLEHRAEMRPELCPAIKELLETLAARAKLLAVVSGNLEAIGWLKLEAAGLRQYFSFGTFSDTGSDPGSDAGHSREEIFRAAAARAQGQLRSTMPPRTTNAPHAAAAAGNARPAAICVVGDTPADIAAARAAGLPIVAVATGIYTREQLSCQHPDLCLGCCAELFPQPITIADRVTAR